MLIHLNRNMCSKVSPICKLLNYIITKMDGTFLSPYILAWKNKNKCLFFFGKVFWLKSFNGIFSNQTLKNRKMEFVLNFYIYTCKSIFNLSNHLSCFFFCLKTRFSFYNESTTSVFNHYIQWNVTGTGKSWKKIYFLLFKICFRKKSLHIDK